ncbi:MAG: adenylate/guanylate cyclase domain-containing protein [candidate division WOR-3 bacterium]
MEKNFFIDISGFTKTTEELIQNSKYGAEIITDIINVIFGKTIEKIYQNNGYVLLFAGDAIMINLEKVLLKDIESTLKENIENLNKKIGINLGFRIEELDRIYKPHLLKCNKRNFLFFHPDDSNILYSDIENNINLEYPEIIKDLKLKNFQGELREIPASFINISKEYSVENLKFFLQKIINGADDNKIYVNKIEYADKGWNILVVSGLPESIENAHYRLIIFLKKVLDLAKKSGIDIKIGCTLNKGFAGFVGNKKRWEYTFIGGNINLAARIAYNGTKNSIFTDTNFYKSLFDRFDFQFVDHFEFKGFKEKVQIYSVGEEKKEQNIYIYVNREQELISSLNLLKENGVILFLEGSGGVGKTTFLFDLLLRLNKDHIKIIVDGKKQPYSSIISLIEKFKTYNFQNFNTQKILLESEKILDLEKKFKFIFQNVQENLILIFDDAHLLDDNSLKLLKWAFFNKNDNINFIFSGRDISIFEFAKSKLNQYKFEIIRLKNFDEKQTREFVERFLSLKISNKDILTFHKISDGNPLYLYQLLSFLKNEKLIEIKGDNSVLTIDLEKIPYTLKELVLLKFDKLPEKSKDFVETGALIGEEFKNKIVLNSIEVDEKNFSKISFPAVDNKLISPKDQFISKFYHSLVKEIIQDRMIKKRIQQISKKIAEELKKFSDDPYSLMQAGDFFSFALDLENSYKCYIESFQLFYKNKNYEYSIHTLKNLFSLKEISVENRYKLFSLFSQISKVKMNLELLKIASDHFFKIIEKIADFEKEYIEDIIDSLLYFARDLSSSFKILEIYKARSGQNFYYLKTLLKFYEFEGKNISKSFEILKKIKRLQMTKEEYFIYKILVATSYFFYSMKKNIVYRTIKELERLKNDIKNKELIVNYYSFLKSFYIHTNRLDEAEKIIKQLFKYSKHIDRSDILNDLSIIYSNKFFATKDLKYLKKATKYQKKSYSILKYEMKLNDLPLITTNLAMNYSLLGNVKMMLKYLYEGLLYGLEIDHPIETPYNYVLLMLFIYQRGCYKLGYKLNDFILNYKYQIDISVDAFIIKYFETGDVTYLKKANYYLKRLLFRENTPPYTIYLELYFNKYYFDDDKKGLLRLKKKIEKFEKTSRLRESTIFKLNLTKYVIDLENKLIDEKNIAKILKEIENQKYISLVSSQLYFSTAKSLYEKSDPEFLDYILKSYKIAKNLCYFNMCRHIENYCIQNNIPGKKFAKESLKTLKMIDEMNRIDELETFVNWFLNLTY